jgi:nicotinamide-nucleotide amidase
VEKLIAALAEKGMTLSTCESFTGGLFSSELTAVSGASAVFTGSIVAYSTPAKLDVVHVDPQTIERYGTISPQAVTEMAEKTRSLFKTDFAVSFSGNAGPLAQENKPVGLWYGAVASSRETIVFGGIANLKRNELREAACIEGIKNLLELIRKV